MIFFVGYSMLSLEEIMPPNNFNLYEKQCFEYLIENGINENDIHFLKEIYEKENIKFCVKTFKSFDLDELKNDLEKKNMTLIKNLLLFSKNLLIKFIK